MAARSTSGNGKIYGLGSNDAGATSVDQPAGRYSCNCRTTQAYNLILRLPAGRGVGQGRVGVRTAELPPAHNSPLWANPRRMQPAIAEKRADGTGCHRLRQVGGMLPERRRQRHIQGAERHCLVPRLPFPEKNRLYWDR